MLTVLVKDIDILATVKKLLIAASPMSSFIFEKDLSQYNIDVQQGDFVAFYFNNDVMPVGTSDLYDRAELVYSENLYDQGFEPGDSVSLEKTLTNKAPLADYIIETNEYIVYDSNQSFYDGDIVQIPFYSEQGQYIILEDVYVKNDEIFNISLNFTDSQGLDTDAETLVLNLINETFSLKNNGNSMFLTETYYQDIKLTIHIWIDPVLGKMDVLYVNYHLGQGGGGASDIRHISITWRNTATILPNTIIRRIMFTNTFGSSASVKRVIVCRKPILAVGDSYVSAFSQQNGSYEYKTVLNHVGERLSDAFNEKRYVINGGRTGNALIGSGNTISARWNSFGQDLCAYHDVIVVPVNGPGLNNLSVLKSHPEELNDLVSGLAEAISKIVDEAQSFGDNLGGWNDVIMAEMIPFGQAADVCEEERLAQILLNNKLARIAYIAGVPLVETYDDYPAEFYYSAGIHPNLDGDLWLAERTAQSYQQY